MDVPVHSFNIHAQQIEGRKWNRLCLEMRLVIYYEKERVGKRTQRKNFNIPKSKGEKNVKLH